MGLSVLELRMFGKDGGSDDRHRPPLVRVAYANRQWETVKPTLKIPPFAHTYTYSSSLSQLSNFICISSDLDSNLFPCICAINLSLTSSTAETIV